MGHPQIDLILDKEKEAMDFNIEGLSFLISTFTDQSRDVGHKCVRNGRHPAVGGDMIAYYRKLWAVVRQRTTSNDCS